MRPEHEGPAMPLSVDQATGFKTGRGPHGAQSVEGEGRGPSPAWVSEELLASTRRVWARALGRSVGAEEALEILTNVKFLAEALRRAKRRDGRG